MHRMLIASLLAALAACSQPAGPAVKVSDSWARATAEGQGAAVYATIRNEGGKGDRLVAASTDRASMAMIHEGGMEGGIARMRMVHSLDVPAGAEVKLAPGGNHIMLEGLKAPLAAGDRFQLTLRFERGGVISVPVSVVAPGSR
jgi:copper(I)-binding protein